MYISLSIFKSKKLYPYLIDSSCNFNETVFIGPLNEERWELAKENVTADFYASCKKLGWDI